MTNVSDQEWGLISHLFEVKRQGVGRPQANVRGVFDAIRWIEFMGERWLYLPPGYPPQQTCYLTYLKWKKDGRLKEAKQILALAEWQALDLQDFAKRVSLAG